MAYATIAQMIERFGEREMIQRTDRVQLGVVDATVAQSALDDASDEADASLAVRYDLPLPSVPTLLVRIVCDIARYRLAEDRVTEDIRLRYEDARKLLDGIARGTVALGLPAAAAQPTGASQAEVLTNTDSEWSREKLGSF